VLNFLESFGEPLPIYGSKFGIFISIIVGGATAHLRLSVGGFRLSHSHIYTITHKRRFVKLFLQLFLFFLFHKVQVFNNLEMSSKKEQKKLNFFLFYS